MFKLIETDIYRLIHSLSTRVILLFAAALAVFCVIMTDTDITAMKNSPEAVTAAEEPMIGLSVSANPEWAKGNIDIGEIICTELKSGMLLILCSVFTALFATADLKSGYIKNIAGLYPGRVQIVFSKLAAIAVNLIFMLAVFTAFTVITGYIIWSGDVYLGSFSKTAVYLGLQYLLHLGFCGLILLLSMLTKSRSFGMTAGILLCCGVTVPLYSGINKLAEKYFHAADFDIYRYMIDANARTLPYNPDSDTVLRAAAVGFAFLAVSAVIAAVHFKKHDIR